MQAPFFERHPLLKDALGTTSFIALVIVGALLINTFVFRSFNVEGESMASTLHTGDRLIVNRLPATAARIQNTPYVPKRGEIIVFSNPNFQNGLDEEYIVKRVVAFEGERVNLENGVLTVYNGEFPDGFNPDIEGAGKNGEPTGPISGTVNNVTVPKGTIFVVGDNREGSHSYDSRSGLGYVPLYDIIGPVSFRIFPFTAIRGF